MGDITYPLGNRYVDAMDVADPKPHTPDRFAVIGEVDKAPVGNAILRIGRTWPEPQPGWMQELHLVLTPAERTRLIADLVAQEPAPKVDVYDDPAETHLAWAWDGGLARDTIAGLAGFLCGAQLAGEQAPKVVYAAATDGTLTPVPYTVTTSPYDAHDYATAVVTVTLAEGVEVSGSWQVDGRS